MSKKTNMTASLREMFASASENFSLSRIVPENAEPLAVHKDKNLATRSRIAAKFSALEDVDLNFLSERMDKTVLDRVPSLPVKLQERVLDASRFVRGVSKGQTAMLLRTVLDAVNKKPGVSYTGLVSSIQAQMSYTGGSAQSRTRNAVNSLIALGVIESSNGMSFSTKGATYSVASNDFAKEVVNTL